MLAGGLGLGVVGLATSVALAGPLDPARLPVDARLVAHADVDAIRASEAGRLLLENAGPGPLGMLERLRRDVGIDPVREVHDITVYSSEPCLAHSVAVMTCSGQGAMNFLDRMHAGTLPEFERGGESGMEYWSWRRGEARTYAALYQGETDDERQVVFADSTAALREALGRLGPAAVKGHDGAPATATWPAPRAGSCVYVWIQHFGECDVWRPQAEVMRHTTSVLLDVGFAPPPVDGKVEPPESFGVVKVSSDSAENAERIRRILDGTLAMWEMQAQDRPDGQEALDLLRRVRHEADGGELDVHWDAPGGRLTAALKTLFFRPEEKDARAQEPGDTISRGTP